MSKEHAPLKVVLELVLFKGINSNKASSFFWQNNNITRLKWQSIHWGLNGLSMSPPTFYSRSCPPWSFNYLGYPKWWWILRNWARVTLGQDFNPFQCNQKNKTKQKSKHIRLLDSIEKCWECEVYPTFGKIKPCLRIYKDLGLTTYCQLALGVMVRLLYHGIKAGYPTFECLTATSAPHHPI